MPRRVRCSPLGRDREVVADVVDSEWVADPRGLREILTVTIESHRYRVAAADVHPVEKTEGSGG